MMVYVERLTAIRETTGQQIHARVLVPTLKGSRNCLCVCVCVCVCVCPPHLVFEVMVLLTFRVIPPRIGGILNPTPFPIL